MLGGFYHRHQLDSCAFIRKMAFVSGRALRKQRRQTKDSLTGSDVPADLEGLIERTRQSALPNALPGRAISDRRAGRDVCESNFRAYLAASRATVEAMRRRRAMATLIEVNGEKGDGRRASWRNTLRRA
jgi:hypothetical protein